LKKKGFAHVLGGVIDVADFITIGEKLFNKTEAAIVPMKGICPEGVLLFLT